MEDFLWEADKKCLWTARANFRKEFNVLCAFLPRNRQESSENVTSSIQCMDSIFQRSRASSISFSAEASRLEM